MPKITSEQLQRHINTHTARSDDDRNAVALLQVFLRSGGKLNENFVSGDTWPNTDGMFELVPSPEVSRRPKQSFVVQIKGTSVPRISPDGAVYYQLKDLAFPAYVASEVTLDPGILFLVLNPGKRGQERVFWKYISPRFLASIDFSKGSASIRFTDVDEIKNTESSVDDFVQALDMISDNHSLMKQLESREYTKTDVLRIVTTRCANISEAIEAGVVFDDSRDRLSRKIWTELGDLCKGALMLNTFRYHEATDLRIAWETALTDIETKFLATFLQGLRYIGLRVPEEGQYERLMLKYYGFLWRIREYLRDVHRLSVLENLENFRLMGTPEDETYNRLLADAIDAVGRTRYPLSQNRYYVQKSVPFYVGHRQYFEITLQLADKYATKYNRVTIYSQIDISSNYSIQVGYTETEILLWEHPSKVKVVTNWRVSIAPPVLNKLAKILRMELRLSSTYHEYNILMDFLTGTGINLLDLIDFRNERFDYLLERIYQDAPTAHFKEVLLTLHKKFGERSVDLGRNTVRYALIRLREEVLEDLLPDGDDEALNEDLIYLSKRCYSFERNPILYNLPNRKTNGRTISRDVLRVLGTKRAAVYLPYIRMKHLIDTTGELFYPRAEVEHTMAHQTIEAYNASLRDWDRTQGQALKAKGEYVYLDKYVQDCVSILRKLFLFAAEGNEGQAPLNQKFIAGLDRDDIDEAKIQALQKAFVESRVLAIYGAAGTGKTTLMNHLSNLIGDRSKLFMSKTHTATENLKRSITAPGSFNDSMTVDQFIKSGIIDDFDVIFVDECSTIDNRTMMLLLQKIPLDSLLVLSGDIYQIESIDFGNWFFYAKELLPSKAVAELNSTWRTKEKNLQELWDAVRFHSPFVTEMLAIDGPFSEDIGNRIFEPADADEVVLCLNYDGKFGLNSINSYFQDVNPSKDVFTWAEWKYKTGDHILFNENERFPVLHNNLKGVIVDIKGDVDSLTFTIDIPILLTAVHLRRSELEWVSSTENSTRIQFSVFASDEGRTGNDEDARKRAIVPFQLAYAVSIHKAQGLEYNSVKIVIPSSNSEQISHGIFYTAITRAKEKLKIFCSADTIDQIIAGFSKEKSGCFSLDVIKTRFLNDEAVWLPLEE